MLSLSLLPSPPPLPFVFGQTEPSKSNPIGAAVSVLLVVGFIYLVFVVVGEPGK